MRVRAIKLFSQRFSTKNMDYGYVLTHLRLLSTTCNLNYTLRLFPAKLLLNQRHTNQHMVMKLVWVTMILWRVLMMSIHTILIQIRSVSISTPLHTYPLDLWVTTLQITPLLRRLVLIGNTYKNIRWIKKIFIYTMTSFSVQRRMNIKIIHPKNELIKVLLGLISRIIPSILSYSSKVRSR